MFKIISQCEFKGEISDVTIEIKQQIEKEYRDLSSQGFRVLGVAYKILTVNPHIQQSTRIP